VDCWHGFNLIVFLFVFFSTVQFAFHCLFLEINIQYCILIISSCRETTSVEWYYTLLCLSCLRSLENSNFFLLLWWVYGRQAHPGGTGYHSIFYHLVLPKYLPWPFSPFFLPRILLALNVLVYPRHLNMARKLDAVWMVIHHFCDVTPCIYRVLS